MRKTSNRCTKHFSIFTCKISSETVLNETLSNYTQNIYQISVSAVIRETYIKIEDKNFLGNLIIVAFMIITAFMCYNFRVCKGYQ